MNSTAIWILDRCKEEAENIARRSEEAYMKMSNLWIWLARKSKPRKTPSYIPVQASGYFGNSIDTVFLGCCIAGLQTVNDWSVVSHLPCHRTRLLILNYRDLTPKTLHVNLHYSLYLSKQSFILLLNLNRAMLHSLIPFASNISPQKKIDKFNEPKKWNSMSVLNMFQSLL